MILPNSAKIAIEKLRNLTIIFVMKLPEQNRWLQCEVPKQEINCKKVCELNNDEQLTVSPHRIVADSDWNIYVHKNTFGLIDPKKDRLGDLRYFTMLDDIIVRKENDAYVLILKKETKIGPPIDISEEFIQFSEIR